MISVKIEGRLGNQLFQYAFIYAAAKKLNTGFYVDKSIEKFLLPQYFDINSDIFSLLDKYIFSITGFKNMFRIHLKKNIYKFANKYFLLKNPIKISNEEFAQNIINKLEDKRLYIGFFQSEKYFEQYKNDIISLFTIKRRYRDLFCFILKENNIQGKKAVVHVRRGDYVDLGWAQSLEYYHKAIKQIEAENMLFIFISDDNTFVEKEFNYISNKYISKSNEIIDFQFLINADICILSCSSFSWWGAYLNKDNPKVIAPKYWLGKNENMELPRGIILKNWIKI